MCVRKVGGAAEKRNAIRPPGARPRATAAAWLRIGVQQVRRASRGRRRRSAAFVRRAKKTLRQTSAAKSSKRERRRAARGRGVRDEQNASSISPTAGRTAPSGRSTMTRARGVRARAEKAPDTPPNRDSDDGAAGRRACRWTCKAWAKVRGPARLPSYMRSSPSSRDRVGSSSSTVPVSRSSPRRGAAPALRPWSAGPRRPRPRGGAPTTPSSPTTCLQAD